MCIYNTLLWNPKYRPNQKNGGIIPPLWDKRQAYVPTGCGQCKECRKKKARDWQVRLLEEVKHNTNGKFVTLTFSNESIAKLNDQLNEKIKKDRWIKKQGEGGVLEGYDRDNAIATLGVRYFLERWRKRYTTSVRHWLITELGHEGTENIHIHGILWTDRDIKRIEQLWQYGHIWPRPESKQRNWVNAQTVNYIIKYVTKIDKEHLYYKPTILTSNDPGIGSQYINSHDARRNKFNGSSTIETYRTRTGHQIAMPIYWRNKIYTEEEREKLWAIKLDKEERWIFGQKISIKNGYDIYDKALEEARELNKKIGYGDGVKNWKREKYENDRREIQRETRIQKAKKTHKESTFLSNQNNETDNNRNTQRDNNDNTN